MQVLETSGLPDATTVVDMDYVATEADRGVVVIVRAGENLLKAIERDDAASATVGCRNGGCGVCRVQLLSGAVRLGKMSRRFVTVEMERDRFALACRVYPETDLEFRLAPIEPRIASAS